LEDALNSIAFFLEKAREALKDRQIEIVKENNNA
jgi:hypothetical protein